MSMNITNIIQYQQYLIINSCCLIQNKRICFQQTDPQSLRAIYGTSIIKKEFHCSDDPFSANKERDIFRLPIPQKYLISNLTKCKYLQKVSLNFFILQFRTLKCLRKIRYFCNIWSICVNYHEMKQNPEKFYFLIKLTRKQILLKWPLDFLPNLADKEKLNPNEEKLALLKNLRRDTHHMVEIYDAKKVVSNCVYLLRKYNDGRNGD